jgi:hypothetical protein
LVVRRRDLHQQDIDGQYPTLEQTRDFSKETWSEGSAILLHGFARGSTEKESVEAEALFHAGLSEYGRSHGHHVHNFDVRKFGEALYQSFYQHRWFAAGVPEHDPVSGFDRPQGAFG